MADIRPFQSYRPAKGLEEKIAALPYDVYNREEACEEVSKNPISFLSIDRAETQFGPEVDTYDKRVYEKARDRIAEYIREGRFVQDAEPHYYLYELVMNGRSQTGIVACASIDDYENQVIKKHENTRADKEQDRINHVDICSMQTGPIFLAYRQNPVIRAIVLKEKEKTPVYDFVSEDGITHRVWVIEEKASMEGIQSFFAGVDSIYIADGHHRCASAVKVGLKRRAEGKGGESDYFLSVLFADEELMILDYNRFVMDLNGHTANEILGLLSERFEISEPMQSAYKPEEKGTFGMYLEKNWYKLRLKPGFASEDPVLGLDVSALQRYVLEPLFGIADPKTDKRIDFIGGIRGLSELERRSAQKNDTNCVAFSMYPTSIGELFAVADAGLLMPPKSTWFEPKLRSGLFLHQI